MRAETIKNYLVKNGIDENRLTTIGYGGDRMIIEKPKTLEQALKNIRVEVHIVP
jgi:outer membrane protein OmpA-like peptidoglycan-associated protein